MAKKKSKKKHSKSKMKIGTCKNVKGKKGIKLCMTRKGPRFKKA